MPLFTVIGRDRPDAFDLRAATRDAHLGWLAHDGRVKLGGPFMDEGGRSTGSLLIVEFDDLAAARAWAAEDPYVRAGLFASVSVEPWRVVVGGLST